VGLSTIQSRQSISNAGRTKSDMSPPSPSFVGSNRVYRELYPSRKAPSPAADIFE
jgi:hypothetical protein